MSHHFRHPWNPQRRERLVDLAKLRQPISPAEKVDAVESPLSAEDLEDRAEAGGETLPAE